jgi:hypothetical protein
MAKWEHPPGDEGANAYMVKVVIQRDQVFVVHADSLNKASNKADKFVELAYVTEDLSDWLVESLDRKGPDDRATLPSCLSSQSTFCPT